MSKSSNLISQDGVIAVITFHSLEDRICKFFLNEISSLKKISRYLPINSIDKVSFESINRKPITPTLKEIEINPPSRSAKLRAVKRTDTKKIETNFIFEKFKYLLEIEKDRIQVMKNYLLLVLIIILIISTSLVKTSTRDLEAKIFTNEVEIKLLSDKKNLILLENNFLSSPERLFELKKILPQKNLTSLNFKKFIFLKNNEQ